MAVKIRNWETFQHYKQRKPPWIKLYREVLEDKEWYDLSGDSAKGLIMLWLIASEADGYLPDSKTLAFRLRISENRVNALLSDCSHWLEEDASNMLALRYQDAMPETETETEKETEKEAKAKIVPSALVSLSLWDEFVEMRKKLRKPLTSRAAQLIDSKLKKLQLEGNNPTQVLEQSIRNSWQDVFPLRKDWSRGPETVIDDRKIEQIRRMRQ